jgi:antitoxin MazE
MIVDVIKIGNSRGLRIPKTILEQCGFDNKVEMRVEKDKLVIQPLKVRQNWEKKFELHEEKEKIPHIKNKWDDQEWEW